MKKLFICIAAILLILTAFACTQSISNSSSALPETDKQEVESKSGDDMVPNNLWTVTDGITIRLSQDCYLPGANNMTIIMENRSDLLMAYGEGYSFEKYDNGKWYVLETKDVAWIQPLYILYNRDKKHYPVSTSILKESRLGVGLYRVIGASLSVAESAEDFSFDGEKVTYQPWQLEFTISEDALRDSYHTPEVPFTDGSLPKKETWQWYTPQDCIAIYKNDEKPPLYAPQNENGLIAIVYSVSSESDLQGLEMDGPYFMDLFDRKTGNRYSLLTESVLEYAQTIKVFPYMDGFQVCVNGEFFYCFINDADEVELVPLVP